ncbi:hypothetical protein LY76DRAFT_633555 [Colletotrichum caudatum]|nr:hypothetical protein LY76DRAFT_633555 [Colletotrichum caudatum]
MNGAQWIMYILVLVLVLFLFGKSKGATVRTGVTGLLIGHDKDCSYLWWTLAALGLASRRCEEHVQIHTWSVAQSERRTHSPVARSERDSEIRTPRDGKEGTFSGLFPCRSGTWSITEQTSHSTPIRDVYTDTAQHSKALSNALTADKPQRAEINSNNLVVHASVA